jgi:hypothetical protein
MLRRLVVAFGRDGQHPGDRPACPRQRSSEQMRSAGVCECMLDPEPGPAPANCSGQPSNACKFVLVRLANYAWPDGTGAFLRWPLSSAAPDCTSGPFVWRPGSCSGSVPDRHRIGWPISPGGTPTVSGSIARRVTAALAGQARSSSAPLIDAKNDSERALSQHRPRCFRDDRRRPPGLDTRCGVLASWTTSAGRQPARNAMYFHLLNCRHTSSRRRIRS